MIMSPATRRYNKRVIVLSLIYSAFLIGAVYGFKHHLVSGVFAWILSPGCVEVTSVITPEVVMLPIRLPELSVNHSVPSGAVTIPSGRAPPVGRENWVITPAVVIRPIALLEELRPKIVNHNAPSGPCVIPVGSWLSAGSGNSATVPPVLIRPIRFAPFSANHKLPSGPAVIP